MRLVYRADARLWVHVPSDFPSESFASVAEWEDDVAERYALRRPEADATEREAVRALAQEALATAVRGGDFALQFWPFPAPLATVLTVMTTDPLPSGLDPIVALLGHIPLAAAPRVDPLVIEGLGEGWIVRFIADVPDAPQPVAGVGAVVVADECAVFIRSAPTTTTMVGLVDAPLRDVLATFQLIAD